MAKCGVDLRDDPFAHGQLYVGLSRVQNGTDILALVRNHKIDDTQIKRARNVVYEELLQH